MPYSPTSKCVIEKCITYMPQSLISFMLFVRSYVTFT